MQNAMNMNMNMNMKSIDCSAIHDSYGINTTAIIIYRITQLILSLFLKLNRYINSNIFNIRTSTSPVCLSESSVLTHSPYDDVMLPYLMSPLPSGDIMTSPTMRERERENTYHC